LIQSLLLFFVFPYSTPVEMLNDPAQKDDLKALMARMYPASQIDQRLTEVKQPESLEISWRDTFCGRYRKATVIGCALSAFQHCNGNVSVVFYSNTIFEKAGVSVSVGTAVTMTCLLLANLPALYMLNKFGRRSLLLFWNWVMVILLFVMSVSTVN
jgi:hypothetical protein